MGDTSLQDRLRDHAKAFDGLLSLIPAKMYYGNDATKDNWQQKKQSKDEANAARRGKLDPDSELNRNAKEVMDERARHKRKLQDLQNDDEDAWEDDNEDGDLVLEQPGEGLRMADDESSPKKPRLSGANAVESRAEKEKRKAKQDKKKAKKEDRKEARRQQEAEKAEATITTAAEDKQDTPKQSAPSPAKAAKGTPKASKKKAQPEAVDAPSTKEKAKPAATLSTEVPASTPSSPASDAGSPIFDESSKHESAEPASTETSISSTSATERPKYIKLPSDTTQLRARLAAKIEELRAARKADGPDGKPIRTRQELIESRREKQVQRKAHKKELRQKAKEEEDRKREEALASARNSPGSILSPMVDIDDDRNANHFAFGRIAFADGTQMSHDLTYEKHAPDGKKKGPSDAKTQLLKLQAQKSRIAGMDEEKRKEVLEKEAWLAARKRTEGEKVRDDEARLKKSVKRKDKVKKKSEMAWKDRTQGVETAKREKQKKREDNLRKRREDKGNKGKKKGGPTKKKSRPGFEGGFGGGAGGGKKGKK